MTRQIAIDTETTGLEVKEGHRIIEVACVELIDRRITGSNYHCYINPERSIDSGAVAVHGLNEAFLADKPVFAQIVEDLMAYISDAELIIHNAPFDLGFLQKELKLCRRSEVLQDQWSIIDTLMMARQKYPRQKNNLDALCKRLAVDNSQRHYHGALIDAQLLAQVYLAMTSGQYTLFTKESLLTTVNDEASLSRNEIAIAHQALVINKASDEEMQLHMDYLQKMQEQYGKRIWSDE
ncbi:MAG: DNA polymerase III subunit epsilon [Gammaproteobacteria bacterium]|nr:DNA polymerase III subunit epsilon [Gammaproteobacteria bacterium]